jgi:hypothetical protein
MRSSHSIAIWLFERLGLDVALAGDLLEECARGRSVIWYWRQVLIAIWVGTWGDILDHKVLALRAVATGCATNYVLWFLYQRFLQSLLPLGPTVSAISWITNLSFILLTQSVTGWVVARTHRAHAIPMVSVFAVWLVLWSVVSIDFSYTRMLLVDSFDQPRFRPYLARYLTGVLVPILAVVVGLLLGGINGVRSTRRPAAPAPT